MTCKAFAYKVRGLYGALECHRGNELAGIRPLLPILVLFDETNQPAPTAAPYPCHLNNRQIRALWVLKGVDTPDPRHVYGTHHRSSAQLLGLLHGGVGVVNDESIAPQFGGASPPLLLGFASSRPPTDHRSRTRYIPRPRTGLATTFALPNLLSG